MIKIAPSILSADFAHMGEDVARLLTAGADWIHCDVMDGTFVPNITFGQAMLTAIKQAQPSAFLDTHLMVANPSRQIESICSAGADMVCVHAEAETHLNRVLRQIRALGKKCGVALNPATPESVLEYLYGECDMFLVMSVNPGYGGQAFIPSTLKKIERICERIAALGLRADIEVDGGINAQTARQAADAGATVLVAGNAVFTAPDMAEAIRSLKG